MLMSAINPLMPIKKTTFPLTTDQIDWIRRRAESTGLTKAEIIRRAIDLYRRHEEAEDRKRLFTDEQVEQIQEIAKRNKTSVDRVIRSALAREIRNALVNNA